MRQGGGAEAKEHAKEATQGAADAPPRPPPWGGRLGGASLGERLRPKAEETRLDSAGLPGPQLQQRLAGVACCMLVGTLLSLASLLSFTRVRLG